MCTSHLSTKTCTSTDNRTSPRPLDYITCRVSVGEIDDDLDKTINLERIHAEPIKPFH